MAPMAVEGNNRNGRQSDLFWTHRSSLAQESNVPNTSKNGASYHEDHHRRQKGLASSVLAHNGALKHVINNR